MSVHRYDAERAALLEAVDALYAPVARWVHYPSEGKGEIFAAWAALGERARAAYLADVRRAFDRAHDGGEVLAYRARGVPSEGVGGASLSTREPDYLPPEKVAVFRVRPEHVLVHWAQRDMPLGGASFGHEAEIVLLPGARPERVR